MHPHPLDCLFHNNRLWSERIRETNPDFFPTLSRQQAPKYLWIGCADSRVPANEICGLLPGEIFVHRNVANIVLQTDLNCLSVMQFAIDVLLIKHIIVCGHYGCGGIRAALTHQKFGLIDNWLSSPKDLAVRYDEHLATLPDEESRVDRLCELNVIHQVMSAAKSTVIQNAWQRQQEVTLYGWVYSLKDGLVRNLKVQISSEADLAQARSHRWEDTQAELIATQATSDPTTS